jgi:hypothetical protein
MVLHENDAQERDDSQGSAPADGPASASGQPFDPAELHRDLMEIRDLLDRDVRRRRQEDFSLVRLCGALLQMLAVAAALWGLLELFGNNNPAATSRFALALFLQLATLTILLNDRRG